jgi:hypothetical protein
MFDGLMTDGLGCLWRGEELVKEHKKKNYGPRRP